jgi:IS30 family transposase
MEDPRTYKQLRPEERLLIASMKLQGASTQAMAGVLARPANTVSRELRRNASEDRFFKRPSPWHPGHGRTRHATRLNRSLELLRSVER